MTGNGTNDSMYIGWLYTSTSQYKRVGLYDDYSCCDVFNENHSVNGRKTKTFPRIPYNNIHINLNGY